MKRPSVATTPSAVLAFMGVLLLAGCGYRLDGKVVDGFGGVSIGRTDDPDARKSGIGGATVELVREPDTMNRTVAARATSDASGRFTLDVGGFGAGWMEERWLVRIRRNGFKGVEQSVELPGSPDGWRVVGTMTRGRAVPFSDPESGSTLRRQADSFGGPGAFPR